jgi:hypothetical protein
MNGLFSSESDLNACGAKSNKIPQPGMAPTGHWPHVLNGWFRNPNRLCSVGPNSAPRSPVPALSTYESTGGPIWLMPLVPDQGMFNEAHFIDFSEQVTGVN